MIKQEVVSSSELDAVAHRVVSDSFEGTGFSETPWEGAQPPTPSEVWEEDAPADCLVDDWIFFNSAKRERGGERGREGGREGGRETILVCSSFSAS